ncbi:unnamed protein product [Protopolystoma xenopodis]|uniref:Uncharacterized protein n=1 Tax=Protopolystoma xenopodis TaxID=117903 RepID=A0A3S5BL74_9PLAT|nr:unnamed protein product [Protopolystoma xenopodis]
MDSNKQFARQAVSKPESGGLRKRRSGKICCTFSDEKALWATSPLAIRLILFWEIHTSSLHQVNRPKVSRFNQDLLIVLECAQLACAASRPEVVLLVMIKNPCQHDQSLESVLFLPRSVPIVWNKLHLRWEEKDSSESLPERPPVLQRGIDPPSKVETRREGIFRRGRRYNKLGNSAYNSVQTRRFGATFALTSLRRTELFASTWATLIRSQLSRPLVSVSLHRLDVESTDVSPGYQPQSPQICTQTQTHTHLYGGCMYSVCLHV